MSVVVDNGNPSFVCLKAAFLALEPANYFLALARQTGGGSLTEEVQNFILELSVQNFMQIDTSGNHSHVKNILKKVIYAVELVHDAVVEGLYEQFTKFSLSQEYPAKTEDNRIVKKISFLFPFGTSDQWSPKSFIVSLHCSLNLLEGDTGCALWPSSLFLSELILSYPKLFSDKVCLEVGSGVGLVGIALAHVGSSKIILTDGDMSSLENMQCNLELNHLTPEKVHSEYLPWEFATECELLQYKPHLVLGADIIYDPKCMPHLVRVLCMLLMSNQSGVSGSTEERKSSIAYIASVIRNKDTFEYFLFLAAEAHLSVLDVTEDFQPLNLLPYMLSYDRTSVRLFRISSSFC